MLFTFKKPPKAAIICYLLGFLIIGLSLLHVYYQLNWISLLLNQQLFIIGAIIVVIGSILNWTFTFLPKKSNTDD